MITYTYILGTQLPQFLLDGGWCSPSNTNDVGKKVVCTQPRRLAAITLAQRVSEELRGKSHNHMNPVGYVVRFDQQYDPIHTKIKVRDTSMLSISLM